jgi:hypothetical protein
MATAVVGGCHPSLVIVPLSGTAAVIFLVLPSRLKERRSQIVKLIQGGQHTTTTAARRQSTRAGSRRRRPGVEDDPRQFTPFLHQSLSGTGGANCTTYMLRVQLRHGYYH